MEIRMDIRILRIPDFGQGFFPGGVPRSLRWFLDETLFESRVRGNGAVLKGVPSTWKGPYLEGEIWG